MEYNKNNTDKRVNEIVKVVNPKEVKEIVKIKPHEISKDSLSMTGHTYTYKGSLYGEIIKHVYK